MRSLQRPGRSPVLAPHGMASTSSPLSTQAAISVLQKGEMRWTPPSRRVPFKLLSNRNPPASAAIVFVFIHKLAVIA